MDVAGFEEWPYQPAIDKLSRLLMRTIPPRMRSLQASRGKLSHGWMMASMDEASDRGMLREIVELCVELAHVLGDGLSGVVIVSDLTGWNDGIGSRA